MQSARLKFSQRLNTALNESGFPQSTEGRQTVIANLLQVNPAQVEEWLIGKSYPKTSKLVKLAKYIRVRSNWLLSGVGEQYLQEDEELAYRKQLMSEYGESFQHQAEQQPIDDRKAVERTDLTNEALELANAFMKLPASQRIPIHTLVMELAQEC